MIFTHLLSLSAFFASVSCATLSEKSLDKGLPLPIDDGAPDTHQHEKSPKSATEYPTNGTMDLTKTISQLSLEDAIEALRTAAEGGDNHIVYLVLEAHPGIGPGIFGEALILAAGNGHGDSVATLLPRATDPRGCSRALQEAAANGKDEIVKFLLPHVTDPGRLGLALEGAALNWHKDTVNLLLERDINIECLEKALKYAAGNNDEDIVKLLLRDSRITSDDAGRALVYAAERGNKKTFELLLRHVTDAKHLCEALFSVAGAKRGWERYYDFDGEMIELLLRRPKITTENVVTALNLAAASDRGEIVVFLLKDHRITDDHAGEALGKAVENNCACTVHLLLPRVTDQTHLSNALDDAISKGYQDIVSSIRKQKYYLSCVIC